MKQQPSPQPAYQITKPRKIQLRGREVVEIDGSKWLGLLETCAYFIREKKSVHPKNNGLRKPRASRK